MTNIEDVKTDFIRDDKQYLRQVPNDGHTIWLMQTDGENRSFRDYENIITCFAAVTESYEDHREAKNLGRNDYVFDDFWRWVQSFPRFEAFIFDQEISRYKRVKRRELEGIFRDQLERLASQSRSSDDKPILNGHSRRIGEEEEEEEEDEYWDD